MCLDKVPQDVFGTHASQTAWKPLPRGQLNTPEEIHSAPSLPPPPPQHLLQSESLSIRGILFVHVHAVYGNSCIICQSHSYRMLCSGMINMGLEL